MSSTSSSHWRCPECGVFDGPITLGNCDVCVDERDTLVDVESFIRVRDIVAWLRRPQGMGGESIHAQGLATQIEREFGDKG